MRGWPLKDWPLVLCQPIELRKTSRSAALEGKLLLFDYRRDILQGASKDICQR